MYCQSFLYWLNCHTSSSRRHYSGIVSSSNFFNKLCGGAYSVRACALWHTFLLLHQRLHCIAQHMLFGDSQVHVGNVQKMKCTRSYSRFTKVSIVQGSLTKHAWNDQIASGWRYACSASSSLRCWMHAYGCQLCSSDCWGSSFKWHWNSLKVF